MMKPPPPSTEPPPHNLSARAKFGIDTNRIEKAPGLVDAKQAPRSDLGNVDAGSRAKILEAQREAALRRRSMQMRSAVIMRADGPAARNGEKFALDPQQTPAIRQQYSAPRGLPKEQQTHQNRPAYERDENRSPPESQTWARSGSEPIGDNAVTKSGTLLPQQQHQSRPWSSSKSVVGAPGSRELLDDDEHGTMEFFEGGQASIRTLPPESEEDEQQRNGFNHKEEPLQVQLPNPEYDKPRRLIKRSDSSVSLFLDEDADREEIQSPVAKTLEKAKDETVASATKTCTPFSINDLDLDTPEALQAFLKSPCPKEAGTLECYVKRHKSGKSALFPEYRVYLKEGDVFLMTSKKRKNKKTSNYLISMARNDYGKTSSMIIGKLRANFVGTEFQIYDTGRNPRDNDPFFDERNDETVRSELGAVLYASNVIGSKGPREMQVCINKIDEEGKSLKQWQPAHKDEEMIQCFKHRSPTAMRNLFVLENKTPKWNEQLGAYVLNFNGRVTQASVKNFILQKRGNESDEASTTLLQFGRVAKDEFTLDMQWPLSPFQAFAIALSSCDSKIACD